MNADPEICLEVIVLDAREARIAAEAGADRLELVAALDRGGLTPDLRVVDEVTASVALPVNVMLRPHDRDFAYTPQERQTFASLTRDLRAAGASAIVFGALLSGGDVDTATVEDVARSSGLPMTFHRAFDVARDPWTAYAALRAIPAVTRLLTSGGASDVEAGRDVLRDLCALRTAPIVLAGGGVTAANVEQIVRYTGVREVHIGTAARTQGHIDPGKIRAFVAVLRSRSQT